MPVLIVVYIIALTTQAVYGGLLSDLVAKGNVPQTALIVASPLLVITVVLS